jgi:hypothetical protein
VLRFDRMPLTKQFRKKVLLVSTLTGALAFIAMVSVVRMLS